MYEIILRRLQLGYTVYHILPVFFFEIEVFINMEMSCFELRGAIFCLDNTVL